LGRIRGPCEEKVDDINLSSKRSEMKGIVIETSLLKDNTSSSVDDETDKKNSSILYTPMKERGKNLSCVLVNGRFVETNGAASMFKQRDDPFLPVRTTVKLDADNIIEADVTYSLRTEDAHPLDDMEKVLLARQGDRTFAVDASDLCAVWLPHLVARRPVPEPL